MRRARRSHLDEDQLEFLRGIDESGSVEDVGELPKSKGMPMPYYQDNQDVQERLLDEIVFKNRPRGPMNPERCHRLREFCQYYPRTCAFDEDFKEKFVYPCTKQGRNIRDPGAYREYLDFMEAIPELRRDTVRSAKYGVPNAIWTDDRTLHRQSLRPSQYVSQYLTPNDLRKKSLKLGMMGQKAPKILSKILDKYHYKWRGLRNRIYKNPEILDDIISEFKMELQSLRKPNGEPYYIERSIDRIIKRFIEDLYKQN
jgi:hypothetical protein